MSISGVFNVDGADLAAPEVSGSRPGSNGWQVRMIPHGVGGTLFTYVTADEAERIAVAWAAVAAELRDRARAAS